MSGDTRELLPGDLVDAGEHAHRVLRVGVGADWDVPAGTLDWDVRTTIEHAAGAVMSYAAHLGSQATAFLGYRVRAYEDAENGRVLAGVPAAARLLASVVAASPAGARAFHSMGMADATGFLAMGCDEILVHAWDVAAGLGIDYEPPPHRLARKVVRRLFPWAPEDAPPWTALLWANGRASLPGWHDIEPEWGWQCAPLSEWDGTIPRRSYNAAYRWDEAAQRWIAGTD